jgi:hypothetical protein
MSLEFVDQDQKDPLGDKGHLTIVGHAIFQECHTELCLYQMNKAFAIAQGISSAFHGRQNEFQTENFIVERQGVDIVEGKELLRQKVGSGSGFIINPW